ncbi:MAG: hypothetical protein ABSH20_09445 [Tepidisphaeraceae bacterium]
MVGTGEDGQGDWAQMKDLARQFQCLSAAQKRLVHIQLCKQALQKWHAYLKLQKRIHYVDSVVGTHQEVDVSLPDDALASARGGRDLANVQRRYLEPIAAIQDSDLKFPEEITYAYYSLCNLFRRYCLADEIDDWLIVNQAISAEINQDQWTRNLKHVLTDAVTPAARTT